eukprot:g4222.t1
MSLWSSLTALEVTLRVRISLALMSAEHLLDQQEEEAKEAIAQSSSQVQEALHREEVALEKLKAAKTAKVEAAQKTHQASEGRADVEKTVKVLELHMEGNQKILDLERQKKEAAAALEAAKKAAEEAKKREKELAEEKREKEVQTCCSPRRQKYVRLEKDEVCHTGAPNLEIASAKALLPSSSFGSQRSSSSARTIASEGGGLSTWGRRNLEGEVRQLRWELNEERLLAGRLRQELQKAQQQLRQAPPGHVRHAL